MKKLQHKRTYKSDFIFSTIGFVLSVFALTIFLIAVWTGTMNEVKESIDYRLLMDAQYLTLWTAWLTTTYFGIKIYNSVLKKDNISVGLENMVITLLIVTGLVYDLYMTVLKSWPTRQPALMVRTIIEHVFNPLFVLGYCLLFPNQKYKNKTMREIFIDSIRILIFTTIYFIWITIRSVSWVMDEALSFPYGGFSPQDVGWGIYIPSVIAIIAGMWGIYIGFYYAFIRVNNIYIKGEK